MHWKPHFLRAVQTSPWFGYFLALLFTAAAFAVRTALGSGLQGVQPFAFFYISIALTAWWAGTGPAVMAAILGLFLGSFLFLEPRLSFQTRNLVPMLAYGLVSGCFVALLSFARQAAEQAIQNAARASTAEAQLRQQNALLTGLAESLLDGVLIVSPTGTILYANDHFREVWKLPPEVLARGSDEAALKWAEAQVADPLVFKQSVARAYAQPDVPVREETFMKDGRIFERFGAPVVHEGIQYGWVWTFRDITDRKQASIQADRQRALLEAVLEACPVGIIVADAKGKILCMNPANGRLWGAAPFSKDVAEYGHWKGWWADGTDQHGKRLKAQDWALARALRGEIAPGDIVEIEPFGAPGTRRTMLNCGAPVRDGNGNIIGGVIAQLDITERKEIEAALRRSEERFVLISRATNDAVWDWDLTTDKLWWNEGIEKVFGYAPESVQPSIEFWYEHIHPEDRERVVAGIQEVIASGVDEWIAEYRYRRKDGTYVYVLDRGFVVHDPAGKPIRMLGGMEDISHRKQTEAALRATEERFRTLFEAAPVGIGRVSITDARWIDVNDALCRMVGYSREEMRSTPWPQITHPEDVDLDLIPFRRMAVGDLDLYTLEKRFLHKQGHPVWARLTLSLVRDLQGKPDYEIAIVEDITERKKAEGALEEAHARLSLAQSAGRTGIFDWFMPEDRVVWSPELEDLYNIPRGSFEGTFQDWSKRVAPEDLATFQQIVRDCVKARRESLYCEFRAILPGGAHRWLAAQSKFFYTTEGDPLRMIGINIDIDDRKRSEARLRESEERFRAVADNIPQLAWMTDAEGKILWFNRRWFDYTGLTLERMQAEGWKAVHHPSHSQEITTGWVNALKTGEPWEDIFPLRSKEGSYRWFLSRAFPIRDAKGKVSRWFGTNTDITAQREAEQALAVRAREQRAVADLGLLGLRERDVQRLLDRAVHMVAETLEVEFCKVLELLPGGKELLLRAGVGWDPGLVGHATVSTAITSQAGYTLQSGSTIVVEDLTEETRFHGPALLLDHHITSGLSCIIRGTGDRPWGIFAAHTRSRHRFTEDDVHFIEAMAHVLSSSIQRKDAEDALADAKAQLQRHAEGLEKIVAERTAKLTETVQELEGFSYSLSHDMRAPLRAMKGFSQILEAEYGSLLGPEGNTLLHRISTAAGRLDQLIRDVLTYSKVVREHIRLKSVCLEQLTRQLIEENPMLQPPNAVVEIQEPLHLVMGHEAYLTQVLSNLLYNAVKFVPAGQLPHIHLWTEQQNSHVRLYVRDNGIGIPKEAQGRIFGMFQRLHNDKEYEGTGIGLAIVRKAVERMGGRLGLESEPGKGSTFWVELQSPAKNREN